MVRPVKLAVASHTEHDAIKIRKLLTQRIISLYREWVMIFCRGFCGFDPLMVHWA